MSSIVDPSDKFDKTKEYIFSTPVDPPFTYQCILNNYYNKSTKACRKGMNFELFEFFARFVGLKWRLIPTEFNAFKILNSTTGEFRGLLGMIDRGVIHGSATLVYLEEEDEVPLAEYSLPVGITYGGFVFVTPSPRHLAERTILNIFLPFTSYLWLSVLLSLMFVFVCYILFRKFENSFASYTADELSLSKLIFKMSVAISSIFLIFSYQSKMTSEFLKNPKTKYPFTNFLQLAEVLQDKTYSMVTHSYSRSFLYTVNNSDDVSMVAIRNTFKTNPMILAKNRDAAVKMVATNPNLMYFASSKFAYDMSSSHYCNLTFIVDPLPRYLVFAFQKNLGLADLFNKVMYASGYSATDLKNVFEGKYTKRKMCTTVQSKKMKVEQPLSLKHISGAFIFMVIGNFISFILFLYEKLFILRNM